MHQQKDPKNKQLNDSIWNEVFEEITSGTEYAIRGNLSEILSFIQLGIEHQSWNLRSQSALAINTVTTKLQSNIEVENLNEILKMLISALSTRYWSGKEKILLSVSSVFINCKLKLNFDNKLVDEMVNCVFKEANKQSSNIDLNYRQSAIRCLGDMVQFSSTHFRDVYFENYWNNFILKFFDDNLQQLIEKDKKRIELQKYLFKKKYLSITEENEVLVEEKIDEKKNEDQSEEDKESEISNMSLKLALLESVGRCWPYGADIQEKYLHSINILLADRLNKETWNNQFLLIKSFEALYMKWSSEFMAKNIDNLVRSIEISSNSVISCIAKTTHSNLKRSGINFLEIIIKILISSKINLF